jgi:hypothetical protein
VTTELLRELAADGYPTDYLLARVRGRRSAMIGQWISDKTRGLPIGLTDEAIWEDLLHEHAWLRAQMNRDLRQWLDPVFALFELKTIVLCLRCRSVRNDAAAAQLLADSQLHGSLRLALLGAADVPTSIAEIGRQFELATPGQTSLQSAYANEGLKGFETRLTRLYLEYVGGVKLHPRVRSFFTSFVDLRNVMTLYKQLRWGFGDAAAFMAGGRTDVSRLQQASASKDSTQLDLLVREIAGHKAPPLATADSSLETILLGSLTSRLQGDLRNGDDVGAILEYAWRVYVHARNRAVLLHASGADVPTIEKELIA